MESKCAVDHHPLLVVTKCRSGKGGATKTSPSAWNDDGLSSLFSTKYTKPIATYYPYKPLNSSTPTPTATPTIVPQKNGGGFPGWAGAIIGVLLGMLILVSLIAGFLLYRRRRKDGSGYGSNSSGRRASILNWLYATRAKSSTKTASELGGTEKDFPGTASLSSRALSPISRVSVPREAASTPVHELESKYPFRF